MERHSSDWRTVLLVLGAGGGLLLALGAAFAMLALASQDALNPPVAAPANRTPLDLVILGSAFIAIGAAFAPSVYYAGRSLRGRPIPPADPRVLKTWQAVLLVLLWLGAGVAAGPLVQHPVLKWITPLLYLLAIGIPVYFFVRLAAGGLHPGSQERLWGVLAAGMGLGIAPAIVLELLLAFAALVGAGVYVGLHPDQLAGLEQLALQLQSSTDLQQVMQMIAPLASSPLAVLAALVFFSGFSPVIEESAKSLAVWSVYDHLTSPAQGFALGALSGAAFGLVESLLVSATPDTGWTSTLLVRGASTMMHIMTASLTGWGIGQLRALHRVGPLVGLYAAAMALHGLWNGAVVLVAFGSLRTALASAGPDVIGILLTLLGGALLLVLFLGIPVGMATLNWRLRAASPVAAPVVEPPAGAEPPHPPDERPPHDPRDDAPQGPAA